MAGSSILEEMYALLQNIASQSSIDPYQYQYYDNLVNKRTIIFNGVVDEDFFETVYLPLKTFEEDDDETPVTFIINTSGGSVFDSLYVAEYLTTYKKKMNMICTGSSMSMGTVLLAAAGKNPNITRYAYKNSLLLIHDGYVGVEGYQETKTAQDLMKMNEKLNDRIKDIFISCTKITEEQYEKESRKQWFIFGDEAKELGLIDKVYGVDAE